MTTQDDSVTLFFSKRENYPERTEKIRSTAHRALFAGDELGPALNL